MAKTLLIVDDEVDFGNLVRRVAEGLGFEVVVLSDSREFKETYNQLDPDKIVLDIVMPGIDGIEIVNWLIEHRYLDALPRANEPGRRIEGVGGQAPIPSRPHALFSPSRYNLLTSVALVTALERYSDDR